MPFEIASPVFPGYIADGLSISRSLSNVSGILLTKKPVSTCRRADGVSRLGLNRFAGEMGESPMHAPSLSPSLAPNPWVGGTHDHEEEDEFWRNRAMWKARRMGWSTLHMLG
ncbi:hypothetical protein E4U54_005079 [Claviceps lovelessii]|nr:hypothetical protein E4U54_005079 [Claviceps lovelessii]